MKTMNGWMCNVKSRFYRNKEKEKEMKELRGKVGWTG